MLQPGQVLNGTYCVEQLLGSGGMADVYLVGHTRLPRRFALKLMHRQVASQAGVRERFRQEAEILAKLHHNHIVGVIDWDTTANGQPYLVMEHIEGETLSVFLRRTGPLSLGVALHICCQIGEGLAVAHAAGVIHRDLKPANIFLDKNGGWPNFVKILDFGIAKVVSGGQPLTQVAPVLMGTPGYMSPEQVMGGPIDGRSDQFALALILYEMLSGQPAFYGPDDTALAILSRIVHDPAPTLPPPIVDRAVQRALAKSPEERFPSIAAFLAAVGASSQTIYSQSLVIPAATTDGNGELSAPQARPPNLKLRRIVPGAAVGVVAGLSLCLALFGWLHGRPPQAAVKRASASTLSSSASATASTASTASAASASVGPGPGVERGGDRRVVSWVIPTASGPTTLAPFSAEGAVAPGPGANPSSSSPASGRDLPRTSDKPVLKPWPARATEKNTRQYLINVQGDSLFTGPKAPLSTARPPTTPTPSASVRIIRHCLEQELRWMPLPPGCEIKLERTGTLKVTSQKPSTGRHELERCLEQGFEKAWLRHPVSAAVRVQYGPPVTR